MAHRRISAGGDVLTQPPGRLIRYITGGFQRNEHIGTLVLHCLKAGNRPVELNSLFGVSNGHIHNRLRTSQHSGTLGHRALL